MVAPLTSLFVAAWLLPPPPQAPIASCSFVARTRPACAQLDSGGANDGGEVDWDAEASKLARPMNEYYKELRSIEAPALVKEFAETAPEQVQFAVKMTVASLLGNLPAVVAEQSIMTTGKNLATLMFNMQMTGYMFRNAEYRKSLVNSLDQSLGSSEKATGALPPVSGTVTVKIADGFPAAEVDAAAYMSELRSEVEGLRAELAKVKGADGPDAEGEAALIQYIQNLDRKDQQELTQDVSPDVLEAMSQLVATILIDFNLEREQELAAPSDKVRELLITQLVTGYKLRELEVKEELKDKFWGADGKGAQ